jgi:catechol 2,3-dioxygenase-like lactoylglutathione lyase family enzyme
VDGIDHLDLVVSDLERSLGFYRELLRPLGYVREGDIVGERGERVVYLGRRGGGGSLGLRERQSGSGAGSGARDGGAGGFDRYAVGVHHVAFTAQSRDAVNERAAWLRASGATLESEPREYDYAPGYYAVFFFDPDGIKLEIVNYA